MKIMNLKKFLPIAFIHLVTISFITGCSSEEKSSQRVPQAPTVSVQVVVAKPEPIQHTISVTGSVLANERVELRSETNGRIVVLNLREGSQVQKGDLLVKINDRDLKASLHQLTLQDSMLSRELYRSEALLKINAISREEHERAENERASVRAQQEVVRTNIERTEIRAPFNGIVGLRSVSEGAYVDPSALLATLQQIDPVKIEFAVPERYRRYIQPGTEVAFSVVGLDTLFRAEVYAVESRIDPGTRSITARAQTSNPERLLYPGAFANMRIILEELDDALLIPSEAVEPEIDGHYVYKVKNRMVHRQKVEVGFRTESRSQIAAGISPGDTVAITGLLQLRDSAAVSIR